MNKYIIILLLLFINCKKNEKIIIPNEAKNKAIKISPIKKLDLEYQNDKYFSEIGDGLIKFENTKSKIELFSDKECRKLINDTTLGKSIIPFLYKPDYGILFFNCKNSANDIYQIILKNSEIAFAKKNDNITFMDWNTFLKDEVISVTLKNITSNSYMESINGKIFQADDISIEDETEITEIKNDWLLINNLSINKKYWIKWKDGNRILVYFNLLI